MTFNIYKTFNGVEFDYYSFVRKMRLVHVDGMGYFVIYNVKEKYGEGVPYKEVTCYSAEYMLNYKPVNLAYVTMVTGGTLVYAKSYKFYDKTYPKDTLMYYLFTDAGFDDWTFDYSSISDDIAGKYRSFDNNKTGLYGFLQNYVSTAYDCVFTYDIENYIVSVHKKEDIIKPTDIVVSFDNLMESSELEELSDDISTVLSVSGADSLGLSRINPTGSNNIYKLDYYLNEDWIGQNFSVTSIKYDEDGNMVMYGNKPATTTIMFDEHVRIWELQIKRLIYSSDSDGSYAWLLKRYIYLNTQYSIVSTLHSYSEYIYSYCTEALSTYQEETKEVKRSAWTSVVVGLGLIAVVVGCVALAAYTGGVSLTTLATALGSGGTALAEALGLSGTAALLATSAGTTMVATGAKTAFDGLLQLGAISYQTNVTKKQMEKYQDIAKKNLNVYKSGNGYVYNLSVETITNIVGGKYNEYVTDEKLYWVSNTYDASDEKSVYQKTPLDKIGDTDISLIYCLDVLENKLNYVKSKIQWYIDIYAYKNWFSKKEQSILSPFLIQSDYSDDSFKATDDIDVDTETDMSKSITTSQGTMTLEEYRAASNDGYYIKYLCNGDSIDYEATPIKFSVAEFRDWLSALSGYTEYVNNKNLLSGNFYIYYDGSYWTISCVSNKYAVKESDRIINQIRGLFPTQLGITQDAHDGNYKYTPKSGDYILLNLYSDTIEVIDTVTVAMQLAKQAYDVLDECSQPQFSFSIECNNFLLMPEYREWAEQSGFDGSGITLGTMITVPYETDIIFTPFVQEISFEYDNPNSLKFTLGNKFNLGTSEYSIGKILSNTTNISSGNGTLGVGKMSNALYYQSGNTIDSINGAINNNASETRKDLSKIQEALDATNSNLAGLNSQLDEYIKQYSIDKDAYNKKFDLIGNTFTHYTPTTEMNDEIEQAKQDALDKAAQDAAAKVEANNLGVIKSWFLEVTGLAEKDRRAAKEAADNAYNNAVRVAGEKAQLYDSQQKIAYDNLDQGIKDNLSQASEALEKANAITQNSLVSLDNAGKLISGGMGLYSTVIPSSNGGTKMVFHNKRELSSSNKIWYITDNGIVWTNSASGVTVQNIEYFARTWKNAISTDGSMVMNEIAAKKITGDLIAGNTITANNLVANTITSECIATGAIVASKIAAGQIYASNLRSDAVFALIWKGNYTSVGSFETKPNVYVTTKVGSTSLAHLADYNAILVYAKSDTGNCSCICSDGNSASLISADSGFSGSYGWIHSSSYVSYTYRSVYMNRMLNIIGFSDAYYIKFNNTDTTTAYGLGLHWHSLTPSSSWSNNPGKCVPQKVFGMMFGV